MQAFHDSVWADEWSLAKITTKLRCHFRKQNLLFHFTRDLSWLPMHLIQSQSFFTRFTSFVSLLLLFFKATTFNLNLSSHTFDHILIYHHFFFILHFFLSLTTLCFRYQLWIRLFRWRSFLLFIPQQNATLALFLFRFILQSLSYRLHTLGGHLPNFPRVRHSID